MFEHWKDHFHPHEGNNHNPHAYRKAGVVALALVVLSIVAFSGLQTRYIQQSEHFLSAVLPSVLVDLTNEDREDEGLSELTSNEKLQQAAQLKANHMAEEGYFSHDSPDGVTPWEWFQEVGYEYQIAGENLAVNFSDSADVEEAWMDSPPHRENIMETEFTEIGIATAKGEYEGEETVFVAQMFAHPSITELAQRAGVADALEEENEEDYAENLSAGESDSAGSTVAGETSSEEAGTADESSSLAAAYNNELEPAETGEDGDPATVASTSESEEESVTTSLSEPEPELATTSSSSQAATTVNQSPTTPAGDDFLGTQSPAQVQGESGIALNPVAGSTGQQASRLAHLMSQPEFIFKTLILTLFGLIALSLLISVGVEAKRHHVHQAVKALGALVVLLVVFYLGTNFLFDDPSVATYSDSRLSAEISLSAVTPLS